ncbi:ABC transporter substrate-binding protein [Actinomycetospora cinnamomea]|uniref:Iron complex transport system substrate-binding protein n=1 Tax=Actinomycetospora cinnamomea TaxID=663609 RepID=A0A2U1FR67_9PSEU|nr:ABC transporter substrate-binding protein [Actinomycetospora cinnamomea]PVZ14649.1 iron complex transport system substrate-binding protein [Actinomycetospora cinnamomea]
MAPNVRAGLSRRGFLAGTGGVAAALALGACGGGGESGGGGGGGGTRTVQGADGPVQIPANPQRIACTDFYTTYALLDVGVTPNGTAEATVGGVLPEYQQVYDSIPKVGKPTALNFEAIAAQGPDLILGTKVPSLPADLGPQLSGIAPTVLLPSGSVPGSWQERALQAADTVNRLPQGEQVKASYDQHAQRVREQFAPTLGQTRWALVRGSSGGVFFSDYPTSWSGVVLADAGFQFGQFAAGKTGAGGRLSYEQATRLDDCDVILHLADTQGGVDANTRTLLAQPAFQQVRAVREGRLFPLPNYYCSHYKQGEAVLSHLETIVPRVQSV